MECVLEDVRVLIHEKKISSMKDLLPLLEQIAKLWKAALDHCRRRRGRSPGDPGRERKLRGTLQCSAVKAPGFGDRREGHARTTSRPWTGGKAVTEDLGIKARKRKDGRPR